MLLALSTVHKHSVKVGARLHVHISTCIRVKVYVYVYVCLYPPYTHTGDVEDVYMRSFAISEEYFGETKYTDLKENGADVPLTNQNRDEYVNLYLHYILSKSVTRQFSAFEKGFRQVCVGVVYMLGVVVQCSMYSSSLCSVPYLSITLSLHTHTHTGVRGARAGSISQRGAPRTHLWQ